MKTNLITIEEHKIPSWTGAELVEITNSLNETIIVLTDPIEKNDDYPENNFSGTVVWSESEENLIGVHYEYLEKAKWKLCADKIEIYN